MIDRRLFLFGGAAALVTAKAVLAKSFVDTVISMPTTLGMGPRWVSELMFSSMTLPGEEIIQDAIEYTFMVDQRKILQMTMNRLASMRWVACNEGDIYVPEGSTLSLLVEPCAWLTTLNVISNLGTRDERIMYSECSKWRGNEVVDSSVEPLDPTRTIKLQNVVQFSKRDKRL